ncbi:MAG: inosine/xanthosine triphosphatase [bacterium]|nr:inosine/xanthosine triphosphatase [bacterium]
MKITVGSKNPQKVAAVEEIIQEYDFLKNAAVDSVAAASDVSDQPTSLDETIQGALNRARNAFKNCDYSIGLESGLMKVPRTKTGYMDFCAGAIYDGSQFHIGLSSCFEYPIEVTKLIIERGIEVDQAVHELGLSDNSRIGYSEGMIGWLTRGKLTRREYTKQALRTALIHLENKKLY